MTTYHPVRFTNQQIDFIQHMMAEKGSMYWGEECADINDTIIAAEDTARKVNVGGNISNSVIVTGNSNVFVKESKNK